MIPTVKTVSDLVRCLSGMPQDAEVQIQVDRVEHSCNPGDYCYCNNETQREGINCVLLESSDAKAKQIVIIRGNDDTYTV